MNEMSPKVPIGVRGLAMGRHFPSGERPDTGLDWVTPHTFRKTVATLISERVDAETASQQLGHSSPAITREFYISKPAIAADVAHVLEELARPEDD
jgi:integrase